MNSKATTCPPTDTLNDFVEGKLEPPTLDECELHIAECPACLETLRGLGTEDTLTGHVAAAMNESDTSGSSVQLDNLLARMLTQPHDFKSPKQSAGSHLTAELMADRAAEVLRCLEPADDQSLGALGDYDLERLIGTGSSGVVFQATDRTLNRTVALKVLRPSLGEMARQRFISEARSAAAIEHPHVVTIYQVGQADRLAFMAMQWIPGQSLEQLLVAGNIFDEAEIRQIARQIAAGLQAAHQRQIIHRDIKPANIWITQQDRSVKILDFGLARIADDDPGLTATGMLAGTPNFMSPEQTKGLELDGRSDLFSLGCLMYRLITGRLPFGASTVLATLQAIQNHQPPSVQSLKPTCSDDLADVTMALLEKQPANRPESASQFVEMLDTDRASWPVQINRYSVDPQTDSSLAKPQASSSRSNGNFARWIIGAIALGLFALGGFFFAPQIVRIATDQGEIVIETNDPDVEVEILRDGKVIRVVDTKTDQSFDIRSGSYEIRAKANPANSEADQDVSFDVTPKRLIMKRGQQQIVSVTKTITKKTKAPGKSTDDFLQGLLGGGLKSSGDGLSRPVNDRRRLVYDGQNFEQWLSVAITDRSPKTVAIAIRACGALAETETQVKELFEVVNGAARRHGNKVIDEGTDEQVMSAMLNAIWNQPPELAVEFVKGQLENGNSRSLDFCVWILVGGINNSIAPDIGEVRQAFVSRMDELLPLAAKRDKLVVNLVASAVTVSRERLLQLNPELQSLVVKLFWEQTKLADSQSVASLGTLAAYVRIDDAKIVEHLANHYVKHAKESNGIYDPYFQALANVETQRNHWGAPQSFQPIVGWHDEIRFHTFLELLVAELSDEAVRRKGLDKPALNQSSPMVQFLMVYQLQECLHAILPKMDNEVRQKARQTFVAVKRDLPAAFKSSENRELDIENNLDALIAACDGKSKPEFIKVGQAKGSTNGQGFGGGYGGGGVF